MCRFIDRADRIIDVPEPAHIGELFKANKAQALAGECPHGSQTARPGSDDSDRQVAVACCGEFKHLRLLS